MLTTTWSCLDRRKEQTASLLPKCINAFKCPFPAAGSKPQRTASWHKTENVWSLTGGKTNGNNDTGHDVFPQNGNYMLAENATSPIAALPKWVRPTVQLGVWSRAEWAHGRKLHPPRVSKSDSVRACVCESGWAIIHCGRRPSRLMKVQNRCVTAASATHSFFFSSTLLSAFLVLARCS